MLCFEAKKCPVNQLVVDSCVHDSHSDGWIYVCMTNLMVKILIKLLIAM